MTRARKGQNPETFNGDGPASDSWWNDNGRKKREREKKERSDQGEGEGGRGIIKWARQRERESGSSYYGGVRSGDFTSRLLRYSVPDQYVKLGLPPLPFSVSGRMKAPPVVVSTTYYY